MLKIFSFLLLILIAKNFHSYEYELIAKPTTIIGCGGILYAGQFIFMNTKDSSQIIGIIKCPDGYGSDFFDENKKYELEFSKDSILDTQYSFMNIFENPADKIEVKFIENIEQIVR